MEGIGGRLIVVEFEEPPRTERIPAGAERLVVAGAMGRYRVRWAVHLARAAEPALRRRMGVPP
jgi:hypothetical protein